MLYIVTYGTDDGKLYFLRRSALLWGVQVENLGLGKKEWAGYQDKLWGVREWIQGRSFEPEDRIMFVDAYDVLLNGGEEDIWRGYQAYQCPDLLVAAEKNSYPFADMADDYPEVDTEYRYLNSGGFIGTPAAILKMINWIEDDDVVREICRTATDQGYVVRYYLEEGREKDGVQLDTRCLVFNCMWGVRWDKEVQFDNGRLVNTVTLSKPPVLHFNGGTYWTKDHSNVMLTMVEKMEVRGSGKLVGVEQPE